ncbi:MAG: flagellar export protein FliJ [Gammaproteobacteria bacterium]|nr:flagellar export protein FliJ [Gammaproteobacteria bacterium]
MVKSQRLIPIHKIAQNNENKAARELGKSVKKKDDAIDRLEQLMLYRDDYQADLKEKIHKGMPGSQLQQYQLFLQQLNAAISQQTNVIEACEEQLLQDQKQWEAKHSKTKVIGQAMEKMDARDRHKRDKLEAKSNDEISTQSFLNRQRNVS